MREKEKGKGEFFVAALISIDENGKWDLLDFSHENFAVKTLAAICAGNLHSKLCECRYRKEIAVSEDGFLSGEAQRKIAEKLAGGKDAPPE